MNFLFLSYQYKIGGGNFLQVIFFYIPYRQRYMHYILHITFSHVSLSIQAPSHIFVPLQVKVWFQNRRTKQKKDQGKDSELRSVVSETAATCSVLRLLEQGRLLTPPGLPGLLPHCGSGTLGSALRPPSIAMASNGSSSNSSSGGSTGTAGGSPPLPVVTSSGTVAGLQSSPAAHSLFSFPMPSLLSGVATRISSNPLSMAGSLAGNLQELSARYLSSSAFEPYSRTNGKESMDKKILE